MLLNPKPTKAMLLKLTDEECQAIVDLSKDRRFQLFSAVLDRRAGAAVMELRNRKASLEELRYFQGCADTLEEIAELPEFVLGRAASTQKRAEQAAVEETWHAATADH